MNGICYINRIAPRWGFLFRVDSFRRALPYADDVRAFSPIFCKIILFHKNKMRIVALSLNYNMIDICGLNRISPRWGFRFRVDSFRRALPYADDFWAFSPVRPNNENLAINSVKQCPAQRNVIIKNAAKLKAESLSINSVGQCPTDRNTFKNSKPQRGVISKNN